MLEISQSLLLFIPEIIMVFGVLGMLMIGAFGYERLSSILAILITFSVMLFIVSGPFNGVNDSATNIFNDMMYINAFSIFGKTLITFASTIILLLVYTQKKQFEMSVLIMLSTIGMMFMISSNSLITLYVSMELMSLSSYILATFDRDDSKSSEAGMKYFILGSIASGLFLMGATFIYGFTGYIGFNEIYNYYVSISGEAESVVIPIGFLVGLVFIIVAFAFKISAVPFHMWTPDVYQGSPTVITAFFASAPKIASIIILVKLMMDPFGELYIQWQQIFMILAFASMFLGSLGAIMQSDIKRLLAYSSIGHVGFILAGLATTDNIGMQSILIYLAIYSIMTLTFFACLLALKKQGSVIENIKDLSGLSKNHPNTALAMTILMLSMSGIPPIAGFFAKFYILLSLINAEMYNLAIAFIIASIIAAYYYLRIIKIMYFDKSAESLELSSSIIIKLIIMSGALMNVLYILLPTPLVKVAEIASLALFR